MKQEPVAWIDPDVIPLTHIIKAIVRREKDEQHTIPLYTEPQYRELSDEEIIRCMVNPDVYSENEKIAGICFARAILKKASEK